MILTPLGFSEVSKYRTENQDCYRCSEKTVVIADGMGGHPNGKDAATFACEFIINEASRINASSQINRDSLSEWLQLANQEILCNLPGSGTTCCVLLLHQGEFHIASVGDSRVYLYRHNVIYLLTSDQNLATTSGTGLNAHILTNHLGRRGLQQPSYNTGRCLTNDTFVLMTDGAYSGTEKIVEETLAAELPLTSTIEEMSKKIAETDPRDNFTVVLANLENE